MNFGKIVFFCFIFTAGISFLWSEGITWEKIKTEKGVSVYKANVQGRFAFRGVGKISGNPDELISIIENPKRWGNWIENFKSGKLIEEINPKHKVFYQAINSPFPASDRDVVFESKIFHLDKNKTRVEMKSISHSSAPPVDGVRINLIFTRYHIEKKDRNTMQVTFESLSEPGGAIPDFLVNWASTNYPISIIEGLRREIKF